MIFKMKRIFLLFIIPFALPNAVEANWFGKYNSRYEANEACQIWVGKGFKYEYETSYYGKNNGNSRRCNLEANTNQILGIEKKGVKRKFYSKYMIEEELNRLKEKVVKHFRF